MTFRELVKKEYPEEFDCTALGGINGCPYNYDYCDEGDGVCYEENKVHEATNEMCRRCWDREVPVNSDLNENETLKNAVNNEEQKLPNKLNFNEGITNYFGSIIEFSMTDIKIEQSVDELGTVEIKGFIRKINDNKLIDWRD